MKSVVLVLSLMFSYSVFSGTKTLPKLKGKIYNNTSFKNSELSLTVTLTCLEGVLFSTPCDNPSKSAKAIIESDGSFVIPKIKLSSKKRELIQTFRKTCELSTPNGTKRDVCSQSTRSFKYKKELKNISVFDIKPTMTNFVLSNGQNLEEFLVSNKEYNTFDYDLFIEGPDNKVDDVFLYEPFGLNTSSDTLNLEPLVYLRKFDKDEEFNFSVKISLGFDQIFEKSISATLENSELPLAMTEGEIPLEGFYSGMTGVWSLSVFQNFDALFDEFNVDRSEHGFASPHPSSSMDVQCQKGQLVGQLNEVYRDFDTSETLEKVYIVNGTCTPDSANFVIEDYEFHSSGDSHTKKYYTDLRFDVDYIGGFKFKAKVYSIKSGSLIYRWFNGTK